VRRFAADGREPAEANRTGKLLYPRRRFEKLRPYYVLRGAGVKVTPLDDDFLFIACLVAGGSI